MPVILAIDFLLDALKKQTIGEALASEPMLIELMDEDRILFHASDVADGRPNPCFYVKPSAKWPEVGPYALILVKHDIPDGKLIGAKVKKRLKATGLFNRVTVVGVTDIPDLPDQPSIEQE